MELPTTPARGMRDLLPDEVELREFATTTIVDAYRRFGFQRIETPAVEHLSLLAGSQGGENEKLIYKILKRGEKLSLSAETTEDQLSDLGLRYDLTVPLARFYANNHHRLPEPFKAIQIGPVWRAERPQKGRYRQFTQCDIDVLGEESLLAEAELIAATSAALAALGLSGFVVRLNDRRLLLDLVSACGFPQAAWGSVLVSVDKLDKLGAAGVVAELEAAGHPEPAVERLATWLEGTWTGDAAVLAHLESVATLSEVGQQAAAGLRELLALAGGTLPGDARVVLDPTLVRGMGYYTGPIFEIGMEGVGYSLAGGGRYDEMIGRLLRRPVPAAGFSIGFERVLDLVQRPEPARRAERIALRYDPKKHDLGAVLAAAAALRARDGVACVSVVARRRNAARQLMHLSNEGLTLVEFDTARGPDGQAGLFGD